MIFTESPDNCALASNGLPNPSTRTTPPTMNETRIMIFVRKKDRNLDKTVWLFNFRTDFIMISPSSRSLSNCLRYRSLSHHLLLKHRSLFHFPNQSLSKQ